MVELSLAEEIPAPLRRRLDVELRREAFELLHGEAVQDGVLPAAPKAWFEGPLGSLLRTLVSVAFGGLIGLLSVLLVLIVLTFFPVPLG